MDISIIIISYNTQSLLRDCLKDLYQHVGTLTCEIIVVDNASKDGSAEMVKSEFPQVILIQNSENKGFGAANNQAFEIAKGEFLVLLNSDAFLHTDTLQVSVQRMRADPKIGYGGVQLVGLQNEPQPSARKFPSHLNFFLELSGLADRYADSQFFGRYNRTWANRAESCAVDWIPGAFAIIPRHVIVEIGMFDERFFLYYEEVDLCRRIQAGGYKVWYWGDLFVTHIGGGSSNQSTSEYTPKQTMLELWRLRSAFLYYHKYRGWMGAWSFKALHKFWQQLYLLKYWNNPCKQASSKAHMHIIDLAWRETDGGKISPKVPW